jgi:hypothetical protein
MSGLPVKRMVLYKHGVGFFERYGSVGEVAQVELTFKKDEMNDVLKSLAAFPQGDAQVINVSYETPEDKQTALQKAPIILSQNAALLDLLRSLRGRQIRLHGVEIRLSDQNGQILETSGATFETTGILLGIDADRVRFDEARVSLLMIAPEPRNPADVISQNQELRVTSEPVPSDRLTVLTYRLPQLRSIEVLDAQSGDDLRYILELSRATGDKRSVTLLLSQPNQDLLVSYVAPTPTWRVSYRLVYTPESSASDATQNSATGKVLLQGWGIVDNQLDEDLEDVELTLIAGQPISFVYDLYTPKLVDRPQVGDEDRTVTGPVMFDAALPMAPGMAMREFAEEVPARGVSAPSRPVAMPRFRAERRDLAAATQVQATGIARGELFQYDVSNPVSIKRGQSAMVPILGATLDGRKEHLYNFEKVPDHPVVTITAINRSGLTLERGPVTVLEKDNYVGEAVLAFTPVEGEFFVPYAVDLGVRVTRSLSSREEMVAIHLGNYDYLLCDYYAILQTDYQIENRNPDSIHLVIEQRINLDYELFATPATTAQTAEFYRWQITSPARTNSQFVVQERRVVSRQQNIRNLDYQTLQNYLHGKFFDQTTYDRLKAILDLHQQIQEYQTSRTVLSRHRGDLATEQQEAAQKLQPLGRDGEEGALRRRYVAKLQDLENTTEQLAQDITALDAAIAQIETQIKTQLQSLSSDDES